ncbi:MULTISPECIES: phage tail tape measure protein [Pseudomonas]|uniref:Tail protein n=1 Tax=Pseudomonas fulva TaxID=47880 RepID=A0A0D0KCQ1_9PSED|nr:MULTISPECIES: phage tail tape measure protein [Pseudomonas]KIP97041.1 tail protein [Pseudomonas fulva]
MADRSARLNFIMRLNEQVTAPLAKVQMKFSDLADQSEKYIKQSGIGLAAMVGAGVAISKAMEPALEQNRALGEVRSLGVAEDALDSLNRKSLAFSVAYGANARDFVASAYSIEGAIKGLTGSQLATFTNASNVLAKATKADADTMGAYVGTMYNLFKGQADAMGKGAWVESLAGQTAMAVQLFRTSGDQIGEAFKAAGGLASTAGVSLAEQMAVLGTLGSTMEGGEAGGLYKAFFENITGASEKLGMSFTDQQGRLLPMLGILEKLKGRFGDLSIEANGKKLRDAFGGEAARLITTLMGDTGRLANGIDQLGRVRGLEQAHKMAKAMVDPWQQFGAAVQALRVSFGQVLIPILAPLMTWLTDIAGTLMRWTLMFPNLARVIGILALAIMGVIALVSTMTMVVGLSKLAWLGLNIVAWRSIGAFLLHTLYIGLFVSGLILMATWMGIAKTASLLWQGALWLVNAALLANPIVWVVLGVVALGAALVAAVVYWDEIVAAITNTKAFKWISDQLAALGAWFDSMGGWGNMARAAWDGIVGIFHKAINGLIEMLNSIPGVNIETTFGDVPAPPQLPGMAMPQPGPTAAEAMQWSAPMPLMLAQPVQPQIPAVEASMAAQEASDKTQRARQAISDSTSTLSPQRATAVPQGGLLKSIQNNQNVNRGTHVEKVEIHTGKAMSPLELENMIQMAAG